MAQTDFGFTGQRRDGYIKLLDYGARWYDARLGRFISADTIIPGGLNPMAFDRYAYVLGNPIRFNDPTGHGACDGPYKVPECAEIDSDGDGKIPNSSSLTKNGKKIWELYQAAKKHYGENFTIEDFLALMLTREFASLRNFDDLENINVEGVDPLEFLQHAMTHAAYGNCAANNGGKACSDLSDSAVINFIAKYSQSVWHTYEAVITNGESFDDVLKPISPVARAVAHSIIAPPNPEWTISGVGIGDRVDPTHPAYYGNASMFGGFPNGGDIYSYLAGKGMPLLWWYGDRDAGQDIAFILTYEQSIAVCAYSIYNPCRQ